MSYVPVIDELACVAHGECEEVAPAVFAVVDDVASVIGRAPVEQLRGIAEACPTSAISILDEETGERLYP